MPFEDNFKSDWYPEIHTEFDKPNIKAQLYPNPNQFEPDVFDEKSNLHLQCVQLEVGYKVNGYAILIWNLLDICDGFY